MSDELHCSWDSLHEPTHAAYTTTNAAEVLPGVTKPLSADIWREWDYVWNYGVTEDLGHGRHPGDSEATPCDDAPLHRGTLCHQLRDKHGLHGHVLRG